MATKPQLDPRFMEELRRLFTARGARCPDCRYSVDGLVSNRCPECGKDLEAFLREYDLYPERFGWRRKLVLRVARSTLSILLSAAAGVALIALMDGAGWFG